MMYVECTWCDVLVMYAECTWCDVLVMYCMLSVLGGVCW